MNNTEKLAGILNRAQANNPTTSPSGLPQRLATGVVSNHLVKVRITEEGTYYDITQPFADELQGAYFTLDSVVELLEYLG